MSTSGSRIMWGTVDKQATTLPAPPPMCCWISCLARCSSAVAMRARCTKSMPMGVSTVPRFWRSSSGAPTSFSNCWMLFVMADWDTFRWREAARKLPWSATAMKSLN
ncbi:MAG: hypothetical protein ABT00_19905 [Bordetella sp. SCN 68-11]|nr:MAG: hypothetical protein ABT00_19905 [Bordetella sp. SCN 68-11]